MKRFNQYMLEADTNQSTYDWEITDYDISENKILSVKRKSDGMIFSLGDEVGHDVPGTKYMKMGKIDRFWKSFDQMRIDIGKLGIVLNDYVTKLDKVEEGWDNGQNTELLRQMVKLSNNSRITQEASIILSEALNDEQMRRVIQWFYHANRS